jgi:glyoxylase-like metal-dependent hydrolase (beta-lactamase superfamily II)
MTETAQTVEAVDVRWMDRPRCIAAWRIRDNLIDCGPTTALPNLLEALGDWRPRRLILTHIHFDHAGAAGVLAQRWPELEVYVHERGAKHMANPERLEASARRVFGDAFDERFGGLEPIPEERLHALTGGETIDGLQIAYTPGHASHHICMLDDSGWAFVGDVAGVRLDPGEPVFAPTPPPDIDLDQWLASVAQLAEWKPTKLGITHYGVIDEPEPHLAAIAEDLRHEAERVRSGMDAEAYVALMTKLLVDGGAQDRVEDYELTVPLHQNYAGLQRWLDRHGADSQV